ncbi:MAG: PD-(D/E)XK nuclease family protein [Thermoleophilia bacterium]|nr:PD-(D/E)XK nuclease family protein [Thermoleophilia bacterium]
MSIQSPIGLTLILGPANSGKMGYVLEWWRQRSAERPVLVAPTGPDSRELTMEMARAAGSVVGQSAAQTFDGLVRLLLDRSPKYVSDMDLSLMTARLLEDAPLEALERIGRLPGTNTALAALVLELGESGRSPEELDVILSRWASLDPHSRPLARDLRRFLGGYTEMCARLGVVTRPEAVREAAQAADAWTRPVALYGFTSFTPGQRALVEALSRRTEVLVTFNFDGSRAIDLSTPAEVSWWRSRADKVEELTTRTLAYSSPAVAYLERHLMTGEPAGDPPPATSGLEGVHFLLAAGRRAEAELAAEHVAALIRGGLRPGDIAVVVRRVRTWSRLLAHVFDSCGITHQMDDQSALGETGLGFAFLSALQGAVSDEAAGVLAYLRSPYSGLPPEEASDLEIRYRRGTAKGAAVLASAARVMGVACLEGLWEVVGRSPGAEPVDESAADKAPPARPSADMAAADGMFCAEAAEDFARRMWIAGLRSATVGSADMEEDARALRAIQAALAAAKGLPGGFEPHLMLRALAQVAVPSGRTEATDAVQILGVQRARARRFKAVVILGLVEGEFPGRPDTPSLLTPMQKARLDQLGEGVFAPEVDEEAALFLSAVSRALHVVVLSSRDAEDDGSEAMPSRFWTEAMKVMGAGALDCDRRTLADQVFEPDRAPSERHYLRAQAAQGAAPGNVMGVGREGAATCALRPWGCAPDRLTAPDILEELAATEYHSPSSLEAYSACPFSWFVQKVIGVEDVDLELDDRLVGQLAHDALSAVYPRLVAEGMLPLSSENMAEAERLAFACADRLVQSDERPGTPAERRLAAYRVKWMVHNLFSMEIAAAGNLVPSDTEIWVGGEQGVDIGGVRIRGRVDRVDSTADGRGLFVVDYKSGGIPSSGALGKEGGLQLPLYLMALKAERPATDVIGGAYLSLPGKERSGVVAAESAEALGAGVKGLRQVDGEGMEELFRVTRETAREAAAGMRAGIIAPRSKGQCPPWCSLGPACRARREGYRP